jgi:hypothetical protein
MIEESEMTKKTADDKALEAQQTAEELRAKADAADLTPEEKKAMAAEQKADDLAAAAKEEKGDDERTAEPSLAGDVLVIDPELPAGDHDAQVFGNNPLNPAPAPGLVETDATVRMVNEKSDGTKAFADVHPDMVGDYARAGWRHAEI